MPIQTKKNYNLVQKKISELESLIQKITEQNLSKTYWYTQKAVYSDISKDVVNLFIKTRI